MEAYVILSCGEVKHCGRSQIFSSQTFQRQIRLSQEVKPGALFCSSLNRRKEVKSLLITPEKQMELKKQKQKNNTNLRKPSVFKHFMKL